MASLFQAGVARSDITPPVGIAHGNWSAQVHERAEGVDLPLSCTVLACSDGKEEVIVAEWELLFPPSGDWLVEVRRRITELTGVPATHIRLSATHTHAGPNLSQPWFAGGAEMIAPYVASLTDRLAGTALAAHRSMRPARVAGGTGRCAVNSNRRRPWPDIGHDPAALRLYETHPANRSLRGGRKPQSLLMAPNPDGFADHGVGVIRIDDANGCPIAILVNYQAHPTILAFDNRLISPDYPGTVRRTVEAVTGGLCMYLLGAAGNQDTIRDASCQPADARWVGRQIGLEAARVAELIETQPASTKIGRVVESSWPMGVVARVPDGEADGTVRAISRRVQIPLRQRESPTASEIAQVKQLEQRLAELRAQGAEAETIRAANMNVRRAALDLHSNRLRSRGAYIEMEFQAIRLGPAALVGIPVEPFAEIGAEVKSRSPFTTTFFSGYTNGVESYMAMPYAFEEGGYEIWMCPFRPEAAGVAINESLKLLNELSKGES
jgi:neutral ceramidase